MKIISILILILVIRTGHKCAHATTAQLSWHVQNCDMVGSMIFLHKIIIHNYLFLLWDLDYELINCLYNGPWQHAMDTHWIRSTPVVPNKYMCIYPYMKMCLSKSIWLDHGWMITSNPMPEDVKLLVSLAWINNYTPWNFIFLGTNFMLKGFPLTNALREHR